MLLPTFGYLLIVQVWLTFVPQAGMPVTTTLLPPDLRQTFATLDDCEAARQPLLSGPESWMTGQGTTTMSVMATCAPWPLPALKGQP